VDGSPKRLELQEAQMKQETVFNPGHAIARDVRTRAGARGRLAGIGLIVALGAALLALPAGAQAEAPDVDVKVMTRNLYLGADLTPAIQAPSTNDFIRANGQIVRDVIRNNFPVRAKGLANEILSKKPDLVGLQEVSLWRYGPLNDAAPFSCNGGPNDNPPFGCNFTASNVRYDYLRDLMTQLNKNGQQYKVLVNQQEFDFEAPTDFNGVPGDGDSPANQDGEENDRLTMRDVILTRVGAGVVTSRVTKGHYRHLYEPRVGGVVTVHVLRGWNATNVSVRGSHIFRFINTHFEAFGDPTIRRDQARELVTGSGPAVTDLPVVLLGDLNSDDDTVRGGDRLAYLLLKNYGFRERSTANPLSCCLKTDIITQGGGGRVSDFDHQVDHVLTDAPNFITLVNSAVTGRTPVNGYWDSDHAGVFSTLRVH
jgi:endonuclease/exonuclease/phosphatase family metal-dependent hydrolase